MSAVVDRYKEFLRRADLLAQELHLVVEFTIHRSSVDFHCVEVSTNDTLEYLVLGESVELGKGKYAVD